MRSPVHTVRQLNKCRLDPHHMQLRQVHPFRMQRGQQLVNGPVVMRMDQQHAYINMIP